MWQGVHDKQFRSCYSISNHITGWYPTHEVPPAVPILPQRAVASIIQGAKGELGSQWVKNVQVIQSLIIYQSRSNIHRSNYPRRWARVRTGQQLILSHTFFSECWKQRYYDSSAFCSNPLFLVSIWNLAVLQPFCQHKVITAALSGKFCQFTSLSVTLDVFKMR